ncbi:hypothetical protein [Stakelama pacifica]|uniref:hypothetical protein n=1 Tax=Stakelama pacifica TaxID=517720 RepID=UPI00105D882D|nr:hypothetical protein [Stakelama pacifica]
MTPLRTATDIMTGEPIGSIPRRGIVSGHWDGGNVVVAFRGGRGSFIADQPRKIARRSPGERGSGAVNERRSRLYPGRVVAGKDPFAVPSTWHHRTQPPSDRGRRSHRARASQADTMRS